MGTFIGHFAPGILFALGGLCHLWVMLHRYFKSRLLVGKGFPPAYEFKSSMLLTGLPGCSNRYPVLAIFMMVATVVHFILEIRGGIDEAGQFAAFGNTQHMTMLVFYFLAAMSAVFQFYRIGVPKDTDYALIMLSLVVETVLFVYHLHGRDQLDVQLHMNVVYSLVGLIFTLALEMKDRKSVLASLSRTILMVTQGFWMVTVGFILYPPSWAPSAWPRHLLVHDQVMIATAVFGMNLAGSVVLAFLMGPIVSARVKMSGHLAPTYDLLTGEDANNLSDPLCLKKEDSESYSLLSSEVQEGDEFGNELRANNIP